MAYSSYMYVTLICVIIPTILGQVTEFISIDCGGTSNYTDNTTGLAWISDDGIQGNGASVRVSDATGNSQQYQTRRDFPTDTNKYCYTLTTEERRRYIIRATFLYGTSVSEGAFPKFQLYLDTTKWSTVTVLEASRTYVKEMIIRAPSHSVDVCLCCATTGSPFISTLEMRPLNLSMYATDYEDQFYMKVATRVNFGAPSQEAIRYPDDPYDRLWESDLDRRANFLVGVAPGTERINTSNNIDVNTREYPPVKVMQTAVVGTKGSLSYRLNLEDFPANARAYAYFAEIQDLRANETRKFKMEQPYSPDYSNAVVNIAENANGSYTLYEPSYMNVTLDFVLTFAFAKTRESTQGPLLNAMEISRYVEIAAKTDANDVSSLSVLRSMFAQSGDPCIPTSWEWVSCSSTEPPRISKIVLSGKNMKGEIPKELKNMEALTELWLDGNSFSGTIPDMSGLVNLKILHLENNQLIGPLPSYLDNLPQLQELYIQNNSLSGEIPRSLLRGNLTFRYEGNPHLRRVTKTRNKLILGTTIGVVAVLFVLSIASILLLRHNRAKKILQKNENGNSWRSSTKPLTAYSIARGGSLMDEGVAYYIPLPDIEAATNNFSRNIGKGSFGPVYYGKLKDGKEVAVKIMADTSSHGTKQFVTEVALLSRIHHRNLVPLIGYCEEGNQRMLVYEYMHNGTLRDHTHGSNSQKHLDWLARLRIAEDAAKGLEYLHTGCNPSIIHRDVKTTNILLDINMRAKVSDFGLSRQAEEDLTHVSSVARGTVGYLDPEYYANQQLTEKSDVYSFGVVLLELISGRKPVSTEEYGSDWSIVHWDLATKKIIGKGHESDGLYILDTQPPSSVACTGTVTPMEAHCRLGHPSLLSLKKLCPQLSKLSSLDCESCQFAKFHRVSLSPRVNKRANAPFELVHSDVWGPCPITSKPGFRYFVTFVDDYSRMTWLYLMKNRSELFTHFSAFCAEIKTQFGVPVKILRSDNAKEYLSDIFRNYMMHNGILHQTSCVDTPSQNGVAERKNRHLLETARALLFTRKVPKYFWADAVSTACFLINRMPSSVLRGESPFHVLFPSQPSFPVEPKIFGSMCFVRDVRPQVTKLDPKSLKCIFLGYSRVQKGYRCFCPSLNKYLVSIDISFSEHIPYSPDSTLSPTEEEDPDFLSYTVSSLVVPPSKSARPPITQTYSRRRPPSVPATTEVVHESSACPDEPIPSSSDPTPSDDRPIALRKGKRSCTYPIAAFVSYAHLSPATRALVASLVRIPKTVAEALAHSGWTAAMVEEMNALIANGTWVLVELPPGKRSIGCKWVFTIKVNPDGSISRLKARLVAKGYAQIHGVDYSETFSPVAKLTSIRLLISLAASNHWPLHQLDIKNAFLHGDLLDNIYMEQPPGFVAQGESHKVCYLRKSLYGLKQSPRAWFGTFTRALEKFGMKQSRSDDSVFYRHSDRGIILLVVYVDDIVITGSDFDGITDLKAFFATQFDTKDLGELKYFLGVEVIRSKKGRIFLSQRKYVLDLLSETGKLEAKPCSTPMAPNLQLTKDGVLFDDPERYRRAVGKLNYLRLTRPDIAYSVSVVSQYMSSPTIDHWKVVEQILCYLKGAPGRGIVYDDHGHDKIECFSDADWAGAKEDRRSTSGYCVFFGGNLISWQSKKQKVVSRSSAESEYRAMAKSTCEIMWVRQFLIEVGLNVSTPAKLWCDNQAARHIASNPVFHERTKHIEIDCHFIREKIQQGIITTGYMKSEDQLGDIFTKALNGVRINYLCNKLGMINIYAPLEGEC